MKKKSLNKKLNLNKEIISKFDSSKILGGKKVDTDLSHCECITDNGASCDFPDGSWCTWTQPYNCR